MFIMSTICTKTPKRKRGLPDLERDGLPGERLDEDLHSTTQTEHEVQRRLLLNVVVGQSAPVLELFASEDESLLIRRDALLVLNLLLHHLDSAGCGNL